MVGEARQREQAKGNAQFNQIAAGEDQSAAVMIDDLAGEQSETERRQELH